VRGHEIRQVNGLYIESSKNPKVQDWAALKVKKGRLGHAAYLAEGARLAEEALQSDRLVEALLLNAAADDDYVLLRQLAQTRKVPIHELSPQAFATLSDTVTSQGVMAVVAIPSAPPQYPAYTLVLDGVQDPGNVGTLLRTADAFGVTEVCCSESTADAFAPKVIRASMGGIFRVSVHRKNTVTYIRDWMKAYEDGNVVITEADGSTPCHEVPFTRPTLIVIGSEASGVSEEAKALASIRAFIPMTAQTESLNAAVAGSIVLYEAYRQRQ
jgi:RNA methyltransferase, TrmH family